MLRALWFLIQILLVVAVCIWLIERPGETTLSAFDYTLTMRSGLFLIILITAAMVFTWIMRFIGAILSLPGWMGGWSLKRRKAKAMRQLTQGYAYLSAGDAEKALKRAQKVQAVLPEARPLALLLQAQSERALGKIASATAVYQQLMKDRDAVFLGLKGLLGVAIDTGQTDKALDYAQQAMKMHPKAGWIVKALYDLQIARRDFDAARQTLKRAIKIGAVDKQQAVSDEIAMLMIETEKRDEAGKPDEAFRLLERAIKLDANFIPAIVSLAPHLLERGKNRRLQNLIEQAWKSNPHPELLPLWDRLAPKNTSRDMLKRMRWYETLAGLNPNSALGQVAAAEAAMEADLTGEARGYLMRAEKLEPNSHVYRLFLKLERAAHATPEVIQALEEKLLHAPPAKVWTCRQTGMIYNRWSPIARPHKSFNTIVWDYPAVAAPKSIIANDAVLDDPMMIGALR